MELARKSCFRLLLCLMLTQPLIAAEPLTRQHHPSLLRPVVQKNISTPPRGLALYLSLSEYLSQNLTSSIHFLKLQELAHKVWVEQRIKKR